MRKLVVLVSTLSSLSLGCLDDRPGGAPLSAVDHKPDAIEEQSGIITRFYDSDNPYTREVVNDLSNSPKVSAEIERFGELGYFLSRENSFVSEGESDDGRQVELTVLSLGSVENTRDAIYLFCVGEDATTSFTPARLSVGENLPSSDAVAFGDNVWLEILEPTSHPSEPGDPAEVWNWRRWGRCVGTGIVAGASACALQCRFMPIIYMKCMGVCFAARVFGTLIQCTFLELTS